MTVPQVATPVLCSALFERSVTLAKSLAQPQCQASWKNIPSGESLGFNEPFHFSWFLPQNWNGHSSLASFPFLALLAQLSAVLLAYLGHLSFWPAVHSELFGLCSGTTMKQWLWSHVNSHALRCPFRRSKANTQSQKTIPSTTWRDPWWLQSRPFSWVCNHLPQQNLKQNCYIYIDLSDFWNLRSGMVFLMGKIPKLRFQIPNSKIKKSKIPKSRLQNPKSPRKNKTVPRKCVLYFLFFHFFLVRFASGYFFECVFLFFLMCFWTIWLFYFFIFCLFRCNAKKRREFPIDCRISPKYCFFPFVLCSLLGRWTN